MRLKLAPFMPVSEPKGAMPLSDLTRFDPTPSPNATRGEPNTCFALNCSIDRPRQKAPWAPIASPPTRSSRICFTFSNLLMVIPSMSSNGRVRPRVVGSTEGERERLSARRKEFNLEQPVNDGTLLAHELVQPVLDEGACPVRIHVTSVRCAWRLAVDEDAKGHRLAAHGRAHAQVEMPSVE